MKRYTVGFVFDSTLSEVALMEKTHPEWQKGKLNGIGGKVEGKETLAECLVREVAEESGLVTEEKTWQHFAELSGKDWQVDFFGLIHEGDKSEVQTMTDEKITWHNVSRLPKNVITNAAWLILIGQEMLRDDSFAPIKVNYHE